jgi:hypothetical protein
MVRWDGMGWDENAFLDADGLAVFCILSEVRIWVGMKLRCDVTVDFTACI